LTIEGQLEVRPAQAAQAKQRQTRRVRRLARINRNAPSQEETKRRLIAGLVALSGLIAVQPNLGIPDVFRQTAQAGLA
jgi:hypothetical protein